MSTEPEDLTLRYLRRLDAKMDTILAEVKDLKLRMTSLERLVGSNGTSEMEHYASVMGRMDRFDDRTRPR